MVTRYSVFVTIAVFFYRALQRMLMLAGQVHCLSDFGFRDFVRVNTAYADASLMHMKHDLGGILLRAIEEALEDVNDKLHWRIVVVQHQDFVHRWTLGALARF